LTAVPNTAAGYQFDGWTGTISSTDNPITVSVRNGSQFVTAVFAFKPEAVNLSEAMALINDRPGPVLVDVSASEDYNNSHILCARNFPWNTLRKQFDVGIASLNPYKTDTILIYDQTGIRSKEAAEYLAAEKDFAYIKYMTAGLDDWMAAGYDTYMPAEDADICTSLAPMADAGSDQTVNEGVRVTLDGSGSVDPGGGALTYQWTQFKGLPNVTIDDADKAIASFISPSLASGDAELVFHLTVTNNISQKHTDSVNVAVLWFNDPPQADAGGEQTVEPGSVVTLDGSASYDPEGEPLSFQWTTLPGGTFTPSLSSTTAAKPTFTAPASSGWAEFMLTVTDNGGKTDTDTVKIWVQASSPTNEPPTAEAAADKTSAFPGEKVTLDGSGSSDPDGTISAYVWTQTDATDKTVALSNSTEVKPTFAAPEVAETVILVFTLMVTDNDGAIDTDTVEITVNKPNQPPTAVATADKSSVSSGEKVTLDGSGSTDPDGTIAAYAWAQTDTTGTTVNLSDTAAVKPTFTAPDVTETVTLVFRLTVTDNNGDTAGSTIRITVTKPSGGSGGGCFIGTLAEGI
jgi:uncharacterized repeat protein (TIGR02543 family)